MSQRVLAYEFAWEAYRPEELPECWSHLAGRITPCRRVEVLFEACGCLAKFWMHSRECDQASNTKHEYSDDPAKIFPINRIWVAAADATCGRCSDLVIETTVESQPRPPRFLQTWIAKKSERTPATVIWNRKKVYKRIANPQKRPTVQSGDLIKRKACFEARILNQQCEGKERQKRFYKFAASEKERDPDARLHKLPLLDKEDSDPWFQMMQRELIKCASIGNPSGSGNPDPEFKF
ncbi:hypothetical protein DL98DRAFT_531619 [Cadophora sp. DSE1049]|nr:hypothetical protein DL98DRAFT_531619 [Cadophora sp. DSE1049]